MHPKSFLQNIIRLLLLFIGFNIIGSIVTFILLRSFFNVDGLTVLKSINDVNVDSGTINALKFMQFIQVFFSFVIPAHLFARSHSFHNTIDYLRLHPTPWKHFALGAFLIILISPLVSYTSILNEQISFPSFLSNVEQYFKNQQIQSEKFATMFLRDNTGKDLIINIFIVGLLASVSEELFFRGVLQNILSEKINNIHIVVITCSILFSALHQEFYALIPRTLLGMALGYAYFFSKSLWVPMLMHFVNNTTAVVLDSLYKQGYSSFNPNTNEYFGSIGLIISLIATIALFWYWNKHRMPSVVIIYGERLD